MKKFLMATLMAVTVTAPIALPSAASAQYRDNGRDYGWHGDDNGNWNPRDNYRGRRGYDRALSRDDRIYRGRDGRAYCRRNDGTTGLVVGAVGGGVLGNVLGGGTLGTLLGAGGGALLGRSIDRNQVRCR
ncbi:glycine zipper 2TM domain-containing protein [Sphingomonas sp. CROZ-RG-20F-R02-07]|uniref:glycine zipper 2TM domain-containing protein n=1 Tax=Sphingomonas sp. CROZ-RG-20F-R02-07 TaxID=2914832 RepID=UPI001F5A17BD|nr:glycine zipper 2TM domain-containing protein [Sphingomonas sp. CROZ-RG-20F-R02-07]